MDETKTKANLNETLENHYRQMSRSDFRQAHLEDLRDCPICGTELEFTSVTHFVSLRVQEEAHCPNCQIRTRSEEHCLQ